VLAFRGTALISCGAAKSGHRATGDEMFFYYAYMVLLVIALVLWAVIAVRDDGGEDGDTEDRR
jgi:hypothetical protein